MTPDEMVPVPWVIVLGIVVTISSNFFSMYSWSSFFISVQVALIFPRVLALLDSTPDEAEVRERLASAISCYSFFKAEVTLFIVVSAIYSTQGILFTICSISISFLWIPSSLVFRS